MFSVPKYFFLWMNPVSTLSRPIISISSYVMALEHTFLFFNCSVYLPYIIMLPGYQGKKREERLFNNKKSIYTGYMAGEK